MATRASGTWLQRLAAALVLSLSSLPATAAPACDDARAVDTLRAEAAKQKIDVSTLQFVIEGPYQRAKFLRTHPTFRTSPALKKKLEKRTFYFVWFHPPFRGAGTRGADLWGLVDAERCAILHLAREG